MSFENLLGLIPEGLKEMYIKHRRTITGSKTGLLKDVYHFPLFTEEDNEIESHVRTVLSRYPRKIKINVAFGHILKDGVDGPLKFFHPSNNSKIFDVPKRIDDGGHIEELLDDVQYRDAVAHAKTQRPSTKWLLMRIACIRLDIFKTYF